MRLHQTAVAGFVERREGDGLLRPLRGPRCIARTQARIGQSAQRAAADIGELAPLLVDPCALLPGQEGLSYERRGQRGRGLRLVEVSRRERFLRLLRGVRRGDDVDPAPLGQVEPVAAEGAGQNVRAVDAPVREHAAQLAHDHGQGFLPRRGRRLSPQCLRELVPRHRPALLGHQVREQEPTLPPREERLVDHRTVELYRNPTREKNLQS